MAITFVAAAQGYDSGSATTVASNQNSGQTLNVSAGDHLFIAGSFFSTGSPSIAIADTSGNTIDAIDAATGTDAGSGNPYTVKIWQVKSAIADAAYAATITLGSAQIQKACIVCQSRGLATNPLDQHGSAFDNTLIFAISVGPFTTTVADEIIWVATHQSWGETLPYYIAGPASYTIPTNGITDTAGLAVEYRIVSAIQTNEAPGMSGGHSGSWQAAYATFSAPASGGYLLVKN